jgi:hypothetical protein
MDAQYRHTQIGWVILAVAAAVVGLAWGTVPDDAPVVPMLVIGAAVALLFGTLNVEVDHEAVRLRFGVGLIRKRIPLADVRAWREVRNPWYAGWGIRLGAGVVLWNVSGLDAVELELGDAKRFRIGTDEPDALSAAIARVRGASPPPAAPGGWCPPPGRRVPWLVWLAAIGLGVALVLGIFWTQVRPPRLHVGPEGLRVDTLFYGATFPADEIVAVSLERRLPRVLVRTNGFAGAGTLRGWFRVEAWGKGRLYVEEGMAPYVVVRLREGFVVVNFREPERTRALYAEIARQWPDRAAAACPGRRCVEGETLGGRDHAGAR